MSGTCSARFQTVTGLLMAHEISNAIDREYHNKESTMPPKTQLPSHTRPICPCPVVERAFQQLELLCPFPDMLVEEARKLGECVSSSALHQRRATSIVRSAVTVLAGTDMAGTGLERMAAIRGSAAYAHTLLDAERWTDAVSVAIEVLAESVGMRRGDEDDQRELWEIVIGQVGSVRGMG